MRTRAERRKANFGVINRKKKLAKSIYGDDYYKHDGQYCKGKIHCSCPLCSAKTKQYGNTPNYKHSEEVKIESMNEKEAEFRSL